MEELLPYVGYDRLWLVGGTLDGNSFGITLKTRKHVSIKDVHTYFEGHGIFGAKVVIQSIYEFKDREDYLDFTGEEI